MIPVYQPWLTHIERQLLLEAFDTGWISSNGPFINRLETNLGSFVQCARAHVCSNGTTALHLALRAVGICAGDKIAMPCVTFAATAFAASYCGAKPVFIDSDPKSWNIDPTHLKEVCEDLRSRGDKLAAVIVVHLFGSPADMDVIAILAKEYDFIIIEDACESFGSKFDDKMTGSIGEVGVFSFYGNKTLTSGEGGAVITNNTAYGDEVFLLRGQAVDPKRRYWHIDIGHNYRMTNMQAAVLLGQLSRFEEIKNQKLRVYNTYKTELDGFVQFQEFHQKADVLPWIVAIKTKVEFAEMHALLASHEIDSRPFFFPMQTMPPYIIYENYKHTVADDMAKYGIMLPSYPQLTNDDIRTVCNVVKSRM